MLKNLLALIVFILAFSFSMAQQIQTDTILNRTQLSVFNAKLFSDSLVSSFYIEIKNEVKVHQHAFHSEHVYVLSGQAEMSLNEKKFQIRNGDLIFIPKKTWHSVKVIGTEPLKVLSIQAPKFNGEDRIMKNQ